VKSFSALGESDLARLSTAIRAEAQGLSYTQEVSQRIAHTIFREFEGAAALIRVYMTAEVSTLPAFNRAFVDQLVKVRGVAPLLKENTLVLSLLGTAGIEPAWNRVAQSEGHVGIPLLGSEFVQSIPMISRLLLDLGVGLHWLDARNAGIGAEVSAGAISGLFYVEDARTTVDDQQRHVIPARSFVDHHGIRTVFGVGGTYMKPDDLIAVVCFTKETLRRHELLPYLALLTAIKSATARTVLRRHIFAPFTQP
jgi:hypothetical protein